MSTRCSYQTPSAQIRKKKTGNLIWSPWPLFPGSEDLCPEQGPEEDGPQEGSAPKEETWSSEPRRVRSRPRPRRPDPQARQPSVCWARSPPADSLCGTGKKSTGAAPPSPPAALTVAQLLRSAPGWPLRSGARGRQPRCCSPRAAPIPAAVTTTVFAVAAARSPKQHSRLSLPLLFVIPRELPRAAQPRPHETSPGGKGPERKRSLAWPPAGRPCRRQGRVRRAARSRWHRHCPAPESL